MSSRHSAVWIDHEKAHVFHVDAETFTESIVHAPQHVLRHPRREAPAHNHPDDKRRFFDEIARVLDGSAKVLIVGPSTAKLHFSDYVTKHASTLSFGVAGVETVDHPTDKQLAAYIRRYFLSGSERHGHPH